jgi:mannose-6-phosphate isomerase-like protein (cupin superfamily)
MKDGWRAFELEDEIGRQLGSGRPYREFLRVPDLSCGIYTLPVGAKDLQGPHDEDEVYLVIRGRGRARVNGVEQEVKRGTLLFVAATSEHSFFEIDEDITLLVFFASGGPEGANSE